MTSTESQVTQLSSQFQDEEKELIHAEQVSNRSNSQRSQTPSQSSGNNPKTRSVDRKKKPRDSFTEVDDASVACGDINFKSLEWWQCGMVMIAETISLGIPSLPSVLSTVGLIPGFLLILWMGILASYSGYAIGQFKHRYSNVNSMGDAFEILWKPLGFPNVGKEFGGAAQTLFLVFSMGSHILTWTICFNIITNHAVCNIMWGVIALIVFWLFDLPRTLKNVSYWSIASFASIFTAVAITKIAVGVQNPGTGPKHYSHWPRADKPIVFWQAFLAVTNIVFAYAGHVAFFSFISELKDPNEFPKALALLQSVDISMYILVAVVVYVYGGIEVSSSALGAAGPGKESRLWHGDSNGSSPPRPRISSLIQKQIIIAGVIYGHVASKYIYIRIYGHKSIGKRTWKAFFRWATITGFLWVIAFVIAESIPNFNDLLGIVSSLFASWFTYGVSGIFWLFINKGRWFSTPPRRS